MSSGRSLSAGACDPKRGRQLAGATIGGRVRTEHPNELERSANQMNPSTVTE
jgi:hypothetical protein